MARKYFGTDGIRGKVGTFPITPDFVMRLGYAAGKVLATNRKTGRPAVLIAKDTRVSGYLLESALEAGFSAAGVDVHMCGPLPTPGVAYLTRALRLSAGVVISASHNPFDDNGIKFFSHDGNKLDDQVEIEIESELEKPMACVDSYKLGKVRRIEDAAGRYIEFCKSTFPSHLDLKGLRIVVDCAHGAAYQTGPAVFHELGAEVIPINHWPDGFNINLRAGATHPEVTQEAVVAHHADVGISMDGDADRLIMVDSDGRIYNGDELLYAIVMDRHSVSPVKGAVGTLMTNFALERAFADAGIGFARAKVGDRYVLETLREKGWIFGGEGSGHLICLDCHSTGDATVSALQVLAGMRRGGKSLAGLVSGLKLLPQTLINVKVNKGFDWTSSETLKQAQTQVEAELGNTGRVLIRASGTEPLLRVMVEAQNDDVALRCAERLVSAIA